MLQSPLNHNEGFGHGFEGRVSLIPGGDVALGALLCVGVGEVVVGSTGGDFGML